MSVVRSGGHCAGYEILLLTVSGVSSDNSGSGPHCVDGCGDHIIRFRETGGGKTGMDLFHNFAPESGCGNASLRKLDVDVVAYPERSYIVRCHTYKPGVVVIRGGTRFPGNGMGTDGSGTGNAVCNRSPQNIGHNEGHSAVHHLFFVRIAFQQNFSPFIGNLGIGYGFNIEPLVGKCTVATAISRGSAWSFL